MIEKCMDTGLYVGYVPGMPGAHSQAATRDELSANLREVIALLVTHGFVEIRQRGSHKQFRHVDGRGTTVPVHLGRDISPILLRKIAADIGLTADELLRHE